MQVEGEEGADMSHSLNSVEGDLLNVRGNVTDGKDLTNVPSSFAIDGYSSLRGYFPTLQGEWIFHELHILTNVEDEFMLLVGA